jgi:hypothetical protein
MAGLHRSSMVWSARSTLLVNHFRVTYPAGGDPEWPASSQLPVTDELVPYNVRSQRLQGMAVSRSSAERRDDLAGDRDDTADHRDTTAGDRDDTAGQRDTHGRRARRGHPPRAGHPRRPAAQDPRAELHRPRDRDGSANDRTAAGQDRDQAAIERAQDGSPQLSLIQNRQPGHEHPVSHTPQAVGESRRRITASREQLARTRPAGPGRDVTE